MATETPNPDELQDVPCLHCRMTATVQRWFDDENGAALWVYELIRQQPALESYGHNQLAMDAAAVACAEVLGDLLMTAKRDGLHMSTMLDLFTKKLGEVTGGNIDARVAPVTGAPRRGVH